MEPVLSPGDTSHRRRRPLDHVLLERLAETAFQATEFALQEQAERIFESLAKLKPGKPSPHLALAGFAVLSAARTSRGHSARYLSAHCRAEGIDTRYWGGGAKWIAIS